MKKVIVIVGPTGVGKTRLSLTLAKYYDIDVISGDSMQIYKQMDIGTAKVTPEEMGEITHHLIDIKEPTENFSVQEYQTLVREEINKQDLPLIVGGTGLYIKSVLYDYIFDSQSDHTFIKEKYQNYTNEELFDYLSHIDKESTYNLHPNNRQRVLRAIEIFETTGRSKSENLNTQTHMPIYDAYIIGLTLDREKLYERIHQRVDEMIEDGLEEEVRYLYNHHLFSDTSQKAIGYKEWFDYFEGKISKDKVIELIKTHSRQYAKRQYTWFNHQMNVHWYHIDVNHFEHTEEKILQDINKWLKEEE